MTTYITFGPDHANLHPHVGAQLNRGYVAIDTGTRDRDIAAAFAILGNMIITSLAARDIISVLAFMQVGGISLLVSIVLFYVVSLMTTNRHPDATLEFLYGGRSAVTDPRLGGAAATPAAAATTAGSSSAASSSSTASTERNDHV